MWLPRGATEIRSLLYASDLIDAGPSAAAEFRVRIDPEHPFPTGASWQDVVDGLPLDSEPLILGLQAPAR